ncbi:MAG: tetratricopeptide repeat protein, partial [Archangium sp.]|nr:tetratricopeptide repeat protein [Archangium sp.]
MATAEALHGAVDALGRGALDEAATFCQRLLADPQPSANAWHVAGVVALQRGELEAAAYRFAQAIEQRPDAADLHANAALVEMRRNRKGRAKAAFKRALKLEPTNLAANLGLGAMLQTEGALHQALERFSLAVKHHPRAPEAWCNLGGVMTLRGELGAAVDAYRVSISVAPTFTGGHLGLISALSSIGNEAWCRVAVLEWQKACPGDAMAAHLATSLSTTEPPPPRCPPEFVTRYFDAFAANYDAVLAHLKTQVSATLERLWRTHLGPVTS